MRVSSWLHNRIGSPSQRPIRLDCPVALIDHHGKRLAIETSLGTVTADAVILTVPTPLIAAQRIRFRPNLPDKVDAASVLPLGLADKLVMARRALIGRHLSMARAEYLVWRGDLETLASWIRFGESSCLEALITADEVAQRASLAKAV